MTEPQNLIQRRGRVKGTLTRVKTFAENIQDINTTEEIITRLEKIEEAWGEFREIEDALLLFPNQASELEEFETKYYDTKALLLRARNSRLSNQGPNHSTIIRQDSTENQSNTTASSDNLNAALTTFLSSQQCFFERMNQSVPSFTPNIPNISLPRLQIPSFSGDFREWPSFQDLFENTVDKSENLTGCQKLQYLKGLLKGEAAMIIRHLNISENNYQEAWDKLKKRYDKKRQITTSMIKTFMDLHCVTQASAKQLRNLYDTFDEVIRGLRALGNDAEKRDPWLIFIALNKLDAETKQLWSKESSEKDFSTFDEFLVFLNKRCDAIEACGDTGRKIHVTKALHATSTPSVLTCPMCNDHHYLFQCSQFKCKSANERKLWVINKSICFNCLQSGHSVKNCRSKYRCKHCCKAHHSLLHGANGTQQPLSSPVTMDKAVCSYAENSPLNTSHASENSSINTVSNSAINPISSINPNISPVYNEQMSSFNTCLQFQTENYLKSAALNPASLLPTALVNVTNIYGQTHPCRILLDSGSQISLISEEYVRRLGLQRRNARVAVSGISYSKPTFTKGKVNLTLSSRFDKSNQIIIEAYIMPNLTSLTPYTPIDISNWHCIQGYQLADPYVSQRTPIDVIVGADKFFHILKEGKSQNCKTHPIVQETIFGWVLCGHYPASTSSNISFHSKVLVDIDLSLKRFWETEELMHEETILTEEEKACEQHFLWTISRNELGRYTVSLPFKPSTPPLGNSIHSAIKRFQYIEQRFKRDSVYKEQYIKFMRDYCELGHMEPIPEGEIEIESQKSYYLPHHAVFKNSVISKIRVVFDGSCKSSTGISLNDKLMVGATIQRDLVSVLIHFRKHAIAISADIEKMYRQVPIAEKDRNFQRVVWRENSSDPLQHFRLLTVTYGTSSAPFLATRVLHQIALDNQLAYPKASAVIQQDFYVDDLLSGANSTAEALQLKTELIQALKTGGFNLTKWRSNTHELITPQCISEGPLHISDNSDITKVLGIMSDSQEDTFLFNVSTLSDKTYTKRGILSEFSRIFDPTGLLAPVTISIKVLFQQLWLLKLEWDEVLPPKVAEKWKEIRTNLPKLSELRIPRRICASLEKIELHGFSDASELAISAVLYCRAASDNGTISVNLAAAKTKVAPLKQVSVPRLELCAAVLLTRLISKVLRALAMQKIQIHCWTDSSIVLSWLSDTPRRWKTYVANRTAEILNTVPRNCWQHVPSSQNPADCATRGMTPTQLLQSQLWWKGPSWLLDDESSWPSTVNSVDLTNVKAEERKNPVVVCHQEINDDVLSDLSEQCSTYSNLVRRVSLCLRFASNCRVERSNREIGFIKAQEWRKASNIIISWVQNQEFSSDINCLLTKTRLPSRSKLSSLHPFIDEDKVLRVGGRLQHSKLNFNTKHPRILPRSHIITKLIVRDMHLRYLHPGISLLMNMLRQEYWILGARHVVKQVTHNCMACFKQKLTSTQQLMGNLPEHRVTIGRPFLRSGVNFAGPINVCTKIGRGVRPFKAYISLFVCFSTKALHLELVSSLSVDAFLAALRRFVARRGIPTDLYSDNGTNFVGASRELLNLHKQALTIFSNDLLIANFLSQNCIRWHFIPPASPHFGGLWEAGVKSVKSHLRRVIGDATPSFEEITTLLTQVEAVLNSRPLCPLTEDLDSLDVLTPAHFLIGDLLTTIPEPELTDLKLSRLGRWQQVQAMFQGFWKRWSRDYLTSLQQRPKLRRIETSLKRGDLVLLSEDNAPPTKWHLGRIIEVHPGADHLVRVVTVKTAKGSYRRSINKVHRLPME